MVTNYNKEGKVIDITDLVIPSGMVKTILEILEVEK